MAIHVIRVCDMVYKLKPWKIALQIKAICFKEVKITSDWIYHYM